MSAPEVIPGPFYHHMNPDKAVITACKKGDERAFYSLFSCCYSVMMGICMRYLGDKDEANATVNQAFLKIIKNLDKWDDGRPFEAWAKTITINMVIDVCRQKNVRHKNMPLSPLETVQDHQLGVNENFADRKFEAEILERMILNLPEMHRQVFNLYALDGFSHAEIATLLNCSVSASKWYLHQARKILQGQLNDSPIMENKYHHG